MEAWSAPNASSSRTETAPMNDATPRPLVIDGALDVCGISAMVVYGREPLEYVGPARRWTAGPANRNRRFRDCTFGRSAARPSRAGDLYLITMAV